MTHIKSSNFPYILGIAKNALLSIVLTLLTIVSIGAEARAPICKSLFERVSQNSLDFLSVEAKQVGLTVETFNEAYRFDSRTPEQIRTAKGFQPNPNKPEGGLLDHVRSKSLGTNRFISLSLEANNADLFLKDVFLIESKRSNAFPTLESKQKYLRQFSLEYLAALEAEPALIDIKLSQLLGKQYDDAYFMKHKDSSFEKLSDAEKALFDQLEDRRSQAVNQLYRLKKGVAPPQVLEFIQYRVEKIRGIDTSSVGIAREKEIVTDNIKIDKITDYRIVYLIFDGGVLEIPKQADQFYSMRLGHTINTSPPDVVFGAWDKF